MKKKEEKHKQKGTVRTFFSGQSTNNTSVFSIYLWRVGTVSSGVWLLTSGNWTSVSLGLEIRGSILGAVNKSLDFSFHTGSPHYVTPPATSSSSFKHREKRIQLLPTSLCVIEYLSPLWYWKKVLERQRASGAGNSTPYYRRRAIWLSSASPWLCLINYL